jgi:hypothetical protein
MNEDKIPNKVLNMKVKGNCSRGKVKIRCKQQVMMDVTQKEGGKEKHGKKLGRRRNYIKTYKWTGLSYKEEEYFCLSSNPFTVSDEKFCQLAVFLAGVLHYES